MKLPSFLKTLTAPVQVMPAAVQLCWLDVGRAIRRHAFRDWGDVDLAKATANDRAVLYGGPVVSAHVDRWGNRFQLVSPARRNRLIVQLAAEQP